RDVLKRSVVLWVKEPERHEAFLGPWGGERTSPWARCCGPAEAEGSLTPGRGRGWIAALTRPGRGQHRHMVRVRQARRKGVREEPAAERPSRAPPARIREIGTGLQSAPRRRRRWMPAMPAWRTAAPHARGRIGCPPRHEVRRAPEATHTTGGSCGACR